MGSNLLYKAMAVSIMFISTQVGSEMIYLLFSSFFLSCSAVYVPSSKCSLQGDFDQPAFMSDGDITIGGIFPLHYRVELPKTDYKSKPFAAQCQG